MCQSFRTAREACKLSQGQLAKLVGVTHATVNKIEAGTRKPSIDLAMKLHEVLGEPIEILLTSDNKAS